MVFHFIQNEMLSLLTFLVFLCAMFIISKIWCLLISIGNEFVELYLDHIWELDDNCMGLQGFLVFDAVD